MYPPQRSLRRNPLLGSSTLSSPASAGSPSVARGSSGTASAVPRQRAETSSGHHSPRAVLDSEPRETGTGGITGWGRINDAFFFDTHPDPLVEHSEAVAGRGAGGGDQTCMRNNCCPCDSSEGMLPWLLLLCRASRVPSMGRDKQTGERRGAWNPKPWMTALSPPPRRAQSTLPRFPTVSVTLDLQDWARVSRLGGGVYGGEVRGEGHDIQAATH